MRHDNFNGASGERISTIFAKSFQKYRGQADCDGDAEKIKRNQGKNLPIEQKSLLHLEAGLCGILY